MPDDDLYSQEIRECLDHVSLACQRIKTLEADLAAARADADLLRGICGDVVKYHIGLVGRRDSETRPPSPDWCDLIDRACNAIDATPATGRGAAPPAPPAPPDAGTKLLAMAKEVLEELVQLDLDGKLSRRQQVATEKFGVAVAAAEAERPARSS